MGYIPIKIISEFSVELATPLAHIYNTCLVNAVYPNLFKSESVTPAPKKYPPEKINDLKKISGLFNCAKIFDKLITKYLIQDMAPSRDPSQYGNEKKMSIQQYLIKMLHKIGLIFTTTTITTFLGCDSMNLKSSLVFSCILLCLGRKWCRRSSKCLLSNAFDVLCPRVPDPPRKRLKNSPKNEAEKYSQEIIQVERMAGQAPKLTTRNDVLTNLNLVLCIFLSSMMMLMILHLLRSDTYTIIIF